MTHIILFEDNPAADPQIRTTHMPAHLAFLEANSEIIKAAGPLFTTSGSGAGGLWLLEAPEGTDIEALIRKDPFWPTGLRKSYEILSWTQVYADGRRRIHPQDN